MILTRQQGAIRSPSLIALALTGLLLAGPAWAQEEAAPEGAAAPAEGVAAPAEAAEVPGKFWMPDAISTYGQGVDDLFWLIFWITGIAFVVVEGLMLWFLFRYRNREGREKAHYTHGNNKLEVSWTLATVAILVFIGIIQLQGDAGWLKIKSEKLPMTASEEGGELDQIDPGTFVLRVYGEQFAWNFNYPGKDGKFEDQRITYKSTLNPVGLDAPEKDKILKKLVVPENVNVLIELVSLGNYNADSEKYTPGVLHSFFSPHLRFKQDLVPFYPGKIWFKVKEGTAAKGEKYEIVCAELCGEGHSKMFAPFEVLSEADLAKELGYDWKTAVPKSFPAHKYYYQQMEEKEDE